MHGGWARAGSLILCACVVPAPSPVDAEWTVDTGIVACSYPLVLVGVSQDPTCAEPAHELRLPVGLGTERCFGWLASSPEGDLAARSATGMRCNPDGSFSFTMYPNTLQCDADMVQERTYSQDVCVEESMTLYAVGLNLDCCSDPPGPRCETGLPLMSYEDSLSYVDGQQCVESS